MARTPTVHRTAAFILAAVASAAALPLSAQSPPYGAQVGSGTLSPSNPRITFSDGPFIVPNVTGLESLLGLVGLGVSTPTCTSTATLPGGALSVNQCDFFNLTVNAPTLAGADNVQVTVSWPDANNPLDQSEFDLFVYDSSNNPIAVANVGTASPRVVTIPVPAGLAHYTVQVVPFNPEGFSYTATIALVPKPAFTPPAPDPSAARFHTFLSPPGLGENAGEPSIGVDWNPNVPSLKHGTVNQGGVTFFQSGPNTLRISFDDCSSPAGHLWEDVSTPFVQQFVFSDPIGYVDSTTGRVFSMDLIGFEGNSFLAYSDDDGNTWTPAQGGGIPGGPDHETLGGGPFASPLPNPGPVYPHAVYYSAQDIAPEAQCSRSDDGGLTFGAGVPIYQTPECVANGSIHGHVKVGPDGTVYIASGSCSAGPGAAKSTDNGITWTFVGPPNQSDYQFLDPSVAIDAAKNVYLIWLDGNTNHPYVSVSNDAGATWSAPYDVGAPFGIQNADFVISTAGDAGRAAVGFVGATQIGNPQTAVFPGIWNLYIATTYDGGRTWTTENVTPNDPVQLGCIWTGGGSNPCRNLLDFNDMHVDSQGRIEVAFAKGCLASANCSLATAAQHGPPYGESVASKAAVARQSGGKPLFAAFDPPAQTVPGNPKLDAASIDPITGHVLLSWEAPDNGGSPLTEYTIYRGTSPGTEAFYATISASSTSFVDSNVAANTAYTYAVTATNGVGTSGHCGEVTATAQVISSGNPCTLPGVTITSDPAGDQNGAPANAQLDITEVDVAEPYPSPAGSSSLVFTIKVPGLSQLPALQPNAEWKVSFNVKDTTGASRIVFVEADTNDPTKPFGEFSYGYTGGTTDNGEGGTGVTGTFNTADGTIVIILDTSKPLAFAPGIGTTDLPFNVTFPAGTVLNAVTGTTVALIGSQPGGIGGGLLLTVDSTSPGTYSVKGNAFCRPDGPVLAVLQASPNTGCTPLTVSFDGSQSFDAAGDTIASYTFNFGDGSAPLTQSSPHATYSYSRAGDYAASLKVTCSRGATSGNVAEAQVAVSAPPAAPVISAPSTAKPGQKGLVASVASHSGSSYQWSVSNGTITGGQGTSSITFTAGLKGNVGLSVTEISAAGCVSPAGTATVTSKK
jgi:PKD domain/BNR repeat-like domain/PKD-like domain/Fibronectin type III domain